MSAPQTDTRTGYVYVLKAHKPHDECYKIGRTNNPKRRLRDFGVKLPFKVEVVVMAKFDDCFAAEKEFHDMFANTRLDGEWFALNENGVRKIKTIALMVQADDLMCRLIAAIPPEPEDFNIIPPCGWVDRVTRIAKVLGSAGKRYRRRYVAVFV